MMGLTGNPVKFRGGPAAVTGDVRPTSLSRRTGGREDDGRVIQEPEDLPDPVRRNPGEGPAVGGTVAGQGTASPFERNVPVCRLNSFWSDMANPCSDRRSATPAIATRPFRPAAAPRCRDSP